MGARGPVGKAPGQRHGHRTKAEQAHDEVPRTTVDDFGLEWPAPSEDWHEIARDWYLSLQTSGQAIDYTPSDIQTARILATSVSRNLQRGGPISSNGLAVFLSGCSDLLCTAGARRRVKMELRKDDGATQNAHAAAAASLSARRAA